MTIVHIFVAAIFVSGLSFMSWHLGAMHGRSQTRAAFVKACLPGDYP